MESLVEGRMPKIVHRCEGEPYKSRSRVSLWWLGEASKERRAICGRFNDVTQMLDKKLASSGSKLFIL